MTATYSQNFVTAGTLRGTAVAMIVVTSLFTIARFIARLHKTWRFQAEDAFALLAYSFFLAMSISYVVVIQTLYHITAVTSGEAPLYANLESDALYVIKIFFCNSMLLFCTLWSVKLSLLFLYRRLMTGLPKQMRWWWAILIFCILTWVGAIISNFTSCSSMHAWFTPGLCSTPRDARAQIASLYYAFATDVLSDIMIMILPIGLIWNLQMARPQKIGIGAIFGVGTIGIVIAIIRVVQIGSKAGNHSTPSSSWLMLWGIIECGIAVIVSCLPSFAVIYRNTRKSRRGYSAKYYEDRAKMHREGVQLSNLTTSSQITSTNGPTQYNALGNAGRPSSYGTKLYGNGGQLKSIWGKGELSQSREELAKEVAGPGTGKIAVTNTVRISSSEVGEAF